MYVYGVKSPSNLGSYLRGGRGLGSLGYRPNQAARRIYGRRGLNMSGTRGLAGFRGVGQDETDVFANYGADIFTNPFNTGASSSYSNPLIDVLPTTSGADVISTVQPDPLTSFQSQSPTQAYNAMVALSTPITNPGDYVSPQAAIAAGVPPAQVNATWATSQGVNSFSTPAAATAALTASLGAAQAAATVAKLWSGGGQPAPTVASGSFLNSSTAGIPNALLLGIGGLALVFGLMSGGRR